MDNSKLWELASETMYAFGPFYQEAMSAAAQETGAPNPWFPLSYVRGADPQPLSLVRMTELNPYTAPERLLDYLTQLAEAGFLESANGDAFCLTETGRTAVEGIFQAANESLKAPLPVADEVLIQIAELLEPIVQTALSSNQMKSKWTLTYSRWTDPGEAGSPAGQVDQYLTDLTRYRDDAHLAAWTPHLVSGPAWEALTFLWREGIDCPTALTECLPYRGHDEAAYQKAFADLAAKGWIEPGPEPGTYQLTDLGRQVREKAEAETDRLFYAPWATLSEEDRTLLAKLLKKTTKKLKDAAYLKLWALVGEASRAIYTSTRHAVEPIAEKHGLSRHLFTLIIAYSLRPDPVTGAKIGTRMPYSHPETLENVLAALADHGALAAEGDGRYALTEKGLAILDELFEVFYTTLDESEALAPADLTDLEDLLGRLVKASLKAEAPANKAVTTLSQRSHPKKEYGLLARIDQHLDDLSAFRDDSHLAAWAPYHLKPEAWDAFTQIWAGEADSLEGLMERLQSRGYAAEAYAAGLTNLVSRGWLEIRGARYEITEAGQALRDEAEGKTNQLFFAPWESVSSLELNRLRYRLLQLIEALKDPVTESEAVA
jgi:DNA-binding PadR family transcriptional regulator